MDQTDLVSLTERRGSEESWGGVIPLGIGRPKLADMGDVKATIGGLFYAEFEYGFIYSLVSETN